MSWPRFAIVVLVATILQASCADIIAVTRFDIVPNLLLIVMVFFAVHCEVSEAIISSFIIGFAADIVATGFPMGPQVISFGVLGTGLAYLRRVITIRQIPHQVLAIFAAGIGAGGLARLLTLVASKAQVPGGFGVLVGTAAYSAVLGPFLFLLLTWVMNIRSRRRVRD